MTYAMSYDLTYIYITTISFIVAFILTWISYIFAKRFMINKEVKAKFSMVLFFVNFAVFSTLFLTIPTLESDPLGISVMVSFMSIPGIIAFCSIPLIIITIIYTAIGITAKPSREYKQHD